MFRLGVAWLLMLAPDSEAVGNASDGLTFGDEIPRREREAVREQLERALPLACEPPPCVDACGPEQTQLSVRIDGASRDYQLSWVARDPRLDEPLTLDSSCPLCGLTELETQITADLGSLCARLQAIDAGPGRAQITTSPARAWLRIDGRRRGHTPWAGELDAGAHELRIGARGYGPQTRTLQVFGGIEERVHVQLLPVPTQARPAWPGWLSLGLGVALGVAGTALIALDGKDWPGRCTGSNVDALGNCRYIYNTRGLGIALASVGAASFSAGVGLLVWAQQEQRGAGLAWRGTF
jgi:hypothetical protein